MPLSINIGPEVPLTGGLVQWFLYLKHLRAIEQMRIKLNIYGYAAKVHWDGERFIGRIDELHVTDAAKSIKGLEEDLKNAVSGLLESALTSKKPRRILYAKA